MNKKILDLMEERRKERIKNWVRCEQLNRVIKQQWRERKERFSQQSVEVKLFQHTHAQENQRSTRQTKYTRSTVMKDSNSNVGMERLKYWRGGKNRWRNFTKTREKKNQGVQRTKMVEAKRELVVTKITELANHICNKVCVYNNSKERGAIEYEKHITVSTIS